MKKTLPPSLSPILSPARVLAYSVQPHPYNNGSNGGEFYDSVTRPFDLALLDFPIEQGIAIGDGKAPLYGRETTGDISSIVAVSQAMQQVLATVAIVAPQKTTVLITGESGTGKELIARALHFSSPRRSQPFVALNCAALSDTLLESEFFGHERGAFTDAHSRRIGCFEAAHGGTLFLDEIGEMSPTVQAKILRVIDDGEVTRMGGRERLRVDARLVVATNRDLAQAVRDGSFRADLYHRLNVIPIALPPLRERKEAILPLLDHFLAVKGEKTGHRGKFFTQEALACLVHYPWPGNVRELENLVERCVLLSRGSAIGLGDLPSYIYSSQELPSSQGIPIKEQTLEEAVEEYERSLILSALTRANFNQTKAAQMLGTTRRILRYKITKLRISREGIE